MTKSERAWKRLAILIERYAKLNAQGRNTEAVHREMVLVRASIIKMEMREERKAA